MTKRKPEPRVVKMRDKVRFGHSPSNIVWTVVDLDSDELRIESDRKARYVSRRKVEHGQIEHMDGAEILMPTEVDGDV